jgi:hypothetical protein
MLTAVVHLPAQSCALPLAQTQSVFCGDCCAKMKACVIPQKDQTLPATADMAAQQAIALIAPIVPSLLPRPPVALYRATARSAESAPESPPRLALLCTLLI